MRRFAQTNKYYSHPPFIITTTVMVHLWLREETKPFEHRVMLTPDACRTLISEGFTITVEKMPARCVPDSE